MEISSLHITKLYARLCLLSGVRNVRDDSIKEQYYEDSDEFHSTFLMPHTAELLLTSIHRYLRLLDSQKS